MTVEMNTVKDFTCEIKTYSFQQISFPRDRDHKILHSKTLHHHKIV